MPTRSRRALSGAGGLPFPGDFAALVTVVQFFQHQFHRHADLEVFHTDALTDLWPEGESLRELASGVLALSISQVQGDYLMWFRPEVSLAKYATETS